MYRKTKQLREFESILTKNSFHYKRSNGSHFVYQNDKGRIITVNKDLNKMVRRRLIKEYYISLDSHNSFLVNMQGKEVFI